MGERLNLTYTQIMMVMTVVTVIIFSYLFFNNLDPFIGITVDETDETDAYVITDLHRLGWAKAVGLSEGDLIVSVNEAAPLEHETIRINQKVEQASSEVLHLHIITFRLGLLNPNKLRLFLFYF